MSQRKSLLGRSGKRFDDLAGQSTVNNLLVLRSICHERKPEHTLEIGLLFGASTAVIAACYRDHGIEGRGQHIAVDPYQRTVWDDAGRITLEDAGLREYVTVLDEFSNAALPRLVTEGWQCDLAYVDGSHLFEDVFVDFYYVNQLLRENGIVLFDDSTDPHVRKVLRFIQHNRGDSYRQLDLTGHRPPAAQTLKYRIGQRFGRVQLTGFQKIGKSRRPWNAPLVRF
ncbi:MAG: class I SAM-dependent methyltransferase [Acidobacteria bacterium]|nr:class I SAM-dependent methyltransferase [Acidobacteriota bacterium]